MRFIQKQAGGHTTSRMIVGHCSRHTPASDGGSHLENAWKTTWIVPESAIEDVFVSEIKEQLWWRRRELNPRPEILRKGVYMLSPDFNFRPMGLLKAGCPWA